MKKLLGYPINEELYQKVKREYRINIKTKEELERKKQVILYLFSRDMTYQEIGDRVGITRERVRQILNREGLSGRERQKEKKLRKQQEKEQQKRLRLETEGRVCTCGRLFVPSKARKLVSGLCPACYLKQRARLAGYEAQRRWRRKHYKELYAKEKARGFPTQKKYQLKHRDQIIQRHRRYYYAMSRKKFAIRAMRLIQTGLQIIGNTCKNTQV